MPYNDIPGSAFGNPNNAVQHDEQGRPYVMANGPHGLQRQYLTSVEDARQHGSNGLFSNTEFNADTGTWDREINWGNIIGLAAGGVAGGNGLAGLFSAGGSAAPIVGTGYETVGPELPSVASAAAAGTGPAAVAPAIPTTMGIPSATSLGLPVTEGFGSAGAAADAIPTTMGLSSGDGVGTNVGMPSMNDVSGVVPGNTFPNGIPSGGDWLSNLPPGYSKLLKALAGIGGLVGGHALGNAGAENAVPPQLSQLLDLSMQRANRQTPLFNATQKGFYDMLPNFAKTGGQ